MRLTTVHRRIPVSMPRGTSLKPIQADGSMHRYMSTEAHIQDATTRDNNLAAQHLAGLGFIPAFGQSAMHLADLEHAILLFVRAQTHAHKGTTEDSSEMQMRSRKWDCR